MFTLIISMLFMLYINGLGSLFQLNQLNQVRYSELVKENTYLNQLVHFLGGCEELEINGMIPQCMYCASGLVSGVWPTREIIQHSTDPMVYCECPTCDPDHMHFESHSEYMKAVYAHKNDN